MSMTLLKLNIKNNATLLIIFCFVMSLYIAEIMFMFDPTSSKTMIDMLDMLPSDLMSAFGYDQISGELTGFIAGFYYGFLVFAFPMVYYVILSNRLVCKMVDTGAFCYLLQTPTSRKKIIITQGIYLLFSIIVLFTIVYFVGLYAAQMMYPNLLNIKAFTRLHISTTLMTMSLAMICFFIPVFLMKQNYHLPSEQVFPFLLLLNMIGSVSEDAEIFKNLSLFSILDATAIIENGNTTAINILFIAMIAILFISSVLVFDKKRLSL